ncbi:asparagine synthetase B [Magnetospirillum sp. UT-4]|uniref:asparagine synthase-related protein n=1 Tax=Magnetospirillum sp. UT-4 TaxID=2681467 RepID=UPI0013803432|nr:asparagine synthetase B [Magnetospirillum sp. UT-4]CAA7612723.1 putative Asparagine synthetase [Magnetospirillum sp. UT-4]
MTIAGLLAPNHAAVDPELAQRLAGSGSVYRSPEGRLALAAANLSTLSGDLWLALDGDVINHAPLRHSLALMGHRFPPRPGPADTVLRAYEQWGADCLSHLQGPFALALWDDRRGLLLLARDKLGRKPLFIARDRGRLAFASSLAPLLDHLGLPRRLDPAGLAMLLAHGVVPAPLTPVAGIAKLGAGEMLVVEGGAVSPPRRWAQPGPDERLLLVARNLGFERHAATARTLLECSVADRLGGDGAGALLSGRPAAAAMAALMGRLSGRATVTVAPVAAESCSGAAGTLRRWAAASRCDLIEAACDGDCSVEAVPVLAAALSEPTAGPEALGTWLAAQAAGRAKLARVFDDCGVEASFPAATAPVPGLSWLWRLLAREMTAGAPVVGSPFAAEGWAGLLADGGRGRLGSPPWGPPTPPAWLAGDRRAGAAWQDLRWRLADAAAPAAEAAAGRHGLAVSTPFLDESLLSYTLAVPWRHRAGRAGGTLARRVFAGLAPDAVPALPLDRWLAGPLGARLETLARHAPLIESGVLSAAAIAALLERQRRRHDRTRAVWSLLLLLEWCAALGLGDLAEGDGVGPRVAYSIS